MTNHSSIINHQSSIIKHHHQSSIIPDHQSSINYQSPIIINHQSPIIDHHQSSIIDHQSSSIITNHQSIISSSSIISQSPLEPSILNQASTNKKNMNICTECSHHLECKSAPYISHRIQQSRHRTLHSLGYSPSRGLVPLTIRA